jgi:HEAT repeat protein
MKTIAVVLLLSLLAIPAAAQAPDDEALLTGSRLVEQTMISKLNDCSLADRHRYAFILGMRKTPEAVIPLMRMLHEAESEQCRIVAALSLCLLGDERGTYAVKRAAGFDRSEKVRTLAAWYYNQYVKPGSFAFVTQGAEPANLAASGD